MGLYVDIPSLKLTQHLKTGPSQKETWGYVSFREGSFFNWLFDSTQKQKKKAKNLKGLAQPVGSWQAYKRYDPERGSGSRP